jgi:hypothetical protein
MFGVDGLRAGLFGFSLSGPGRAKTSVNIYSHVVWFSIMRALSSPPEQTICCGGFLVLGKIAGV